MKAKRKYGFKPDYAVPPGETLREVMDTQAMTQTEFAVRTGLTVQSLSRIFKGEQPLTYDTANRLELVTGVPAGFWNNLESGYREQQAKRKALADFESGRAWLETIPTKELISREEIEAQADPRHLLRETLAFYGVSSVQAWHAIWDRPTVAARRSACFESQPGPASAWIRIGERAAFEVECEPYDAERFRAALQDIRQATAANPRTFQALMKTRCAEAGVALVFVPEMRKVPWSGATRWLTPAKAMILLNLRGKAEDKFWFSFFHEASHVLNDGKMRLSINDGTVDDPCEARAERFAAEILIPHRWDAKISTAKSALQLTDLSEAIGVSSGIVAGRFQHLTQKWHFYHHLIRQFTWAAEE